jgi:hypothetical protein
MGPTGIYLIINTLQAIGFIFVAWVVLLYYKYLPLMLNFHGIMILYITIPVTVLYVILYSYFLSISLRWFTVISSVNNLYLIYLDRNEKK